MVFLISIMRLFHAKLCEKSDLAKPLTKLSLCHWRQNIIIWLNVQ